MIYKENMLRLTIYDHSWYESWSLCTDISFLRKLLVLTPLILPLLIFPNNNNQSFGLDESEEEDEEEITNEVKRSMA